MASDPVQVPATAIKDQPRDAQEGTTIGINLFREPAWERLDRMLIQPFIGPARSYPINAREVDRGLAENSRQRIRGTEFYGTEERDRFTP